MFEISQETWQKAREIQLQLSEKIAPGTPRIHYLPRYHEIPTSEGRKAMGTPELTHNFIAINDELYAIANERDSPLLGRGRFGQVFLGQNSKGKTCAIKKESAAKQHPNELAALDKLGYLQGKAHINNDFYTIMDVFPGTSLMKMHEQGKSPDPWQAAAQELGYSSENLAEVKKLLMGYDDFDDSFSSDLVLQTMSKNTAPFTHEDVKKLKEKADDIHNNNAYSRLERTHFAFAAAQEVKRAFDMGILHRDIKGDNFVGKLDDDGHIQVTMIDFGGAIDIAHAAADKKLVGTPLYMAPEVFRALHAALLEKINREELLPRGPVEFSTASDIYSFAKMCELDFGLDEHAGFGILKLAQATEPSDRPSIDEICCLLKADLALQSGNHNEQEQTLTEIQALAPSICITKALKNDLSQKLIKATLTHIRSNESYENKENYQL